MLKLEFCLACGSQELAKPCGQKVTDIGGEDRLGTVSLVSDCCRCQAGRVVDLSPEKAVGRIRTAVCLSQLLVSAATQFRDEFEYAGNLVWDCDEDVVGVVETLVGACEASIENFLEDAAVLRSSGSTKERCLGDGSVPRRWRTCLERILSVGGLLRSGTVVAGGETTFR
jgi:hypothetical protein